MAAMTSFWRWRRI